MKNFDFDWKNTFNCQNLVLTLYYTQTNKF